MRKGVLAVAVVVAAVAPGSALAHAILERAEPGTQTRVETTPTEVRLAFSKPVTISSRSLEVFAASGRLVSGRPRLVAGARIVVARVRGLRPGAAYTVRWKVVGPDGHSPAGVYTFGVGVVPPPPTAAVGARGVTWRDDLARWLLFAALALVIGPLVVRLVILRGGVPATLERRLHLLTTVAAFSVINVGIAAFVVRASNALQLPFSDLLYGDLEPFAEKTRFGIAFLVMTVGFGVVAGLLVLAWVFDLAAPRWWALGISLALVSGLSLSGHQATQEGATWVGELADWLHLVAASVWVGGLVTLAFLVWPAAPALRRAAFLGFSRLAVGVVGGMILAGAYLALARLPEPSALWETGYGQMLLVKLGIAAVALGWGGFHHVVVRPRLEAGESPRVRASLVGESVAALVVLLAAAVLTNVTPPPPEPDAAAAVRPERR